MAKKKSEWRFHYYPSLTSTQSFKWLQLTTKKIFSDTHYCGPGGSGDVLGPVDDACRIHDEDYTKPYKMDYFKSQDADKMFMHRMRRAKPRSRRQWITKRVALGYFGLKTAIWDHYDKMSGMFTGEQSKTPWGMVQSYWDGPYEDEKGYLPPNQGTKRKSDEEKESGFRKGRVVQVPVRKMIAGKKLATKASYGSLQGWPAGRVFRKTRANAKARFFQRLRRVRNRRIRRRR